MREILIALTFVALIAGDVALLTYAVPAIHKWEKANDYPFGRMCEVYRNCSWHR